MEALGSTRSHVISALPLDARHERRRALTGHIQAAPRDNYCCCLFPPERFII